RRNHSDAGRTVVVRAGESLVVRGVGRFEQASSAIAYGLRPRARPGWALKRLDAAEGDQRFVLRDLERDTFLRMDETDAGLFELLDGTTSLADLVAAAERRAGSEGPARLARLLADLGERGLLEGVAGAPAPAGAPGRLARVLRPRERATTRAG